MALYATTLTYRLPQASVYLWPRIAGLWRCGWDTREIAQRLGISEAQVHNSLPHARLQYREEGKQ